MGIGLFILLTSQADQNPPSPVDVTVPAPVPQASPPVSPTPAPPASQASVPPSEVKTYPRHQRRHRRRREPRPAIPAPDATGSGSSAAGGAPIKCPGDTVVWLNIPTNIFHFSCSYWFGNTENGTFMCERAAEAGGARAGRSPTKDCNY